MDRDMDIKTFKHSNIKTKTMEIAIGIRRKWQRK